MSSNWINALDACSSAGILDYDAPADLLDMECRYLGNPNFDSIPALKEYKASGAKLSCLDKDKFSGSNSDLVQNPSWKKWLIGGVVAVGVVALAFKKFNIKLPKFKLPKFSELKSKIKMPTMDGIKKFFTNTFDKVKGFFKKKA